MGCIDMPHRSGPFNLLLPKERLPIGIPAYGQLDDSVNDQCDQTENAGGRDPENRQYRDIARVGPPILGRDHDRSDRRTGAE